jgi:hypothetical protein
MSMGDFYGIEPGTIPGFAETGAGKFIGAGGLPGSTVTNMVAFMEKLRRSTASTSASLRGVWVPPTGADRSGRCRDQR